ncbi:terpenoid cyclases/protein prenyltransferase alpha-alpha toroid [Halteromyces radiatus]|uniref:terpenoid cyclases/protein prenyltransferase alpha-alpha toroid n=1 Tax=Halteromyces radiatus TaxID=101107 RepID=UPI00222113D7|nr:terpenoid cyclases/protein prenyltransferase alpha-alpha toroid [Halteromyces radiatus]KAI8096543.1 terpenoid cyclases/protein prenyltransferase alpha-alpha toroid [Halteromyces radiatus]
MGILNEAIPLSQLRIKDDGLPTETSFEQKRTEDLVLEAFVPYAPNNVNREPLESVQLERAKHIAYLKRGLTHLGRWMVALDASRPWLMYWMLHSLDLLEEPLSEDIQTRAVSTLATCQHPSGGFGGGPGQLPHLATTYAAINTLAIIGTTQAYELIDKPALYRFLLEMKQPDGSFTMHNGGEIDIRGSYCALSVATLTNLLTPDLTENCGDFIARAQTFEGGIGPFPGKEAHNGYTFCGLAAIEILGEMHKLDMNKLAKWCTDRQMQLEGGFQGRTNKLVDGCYSFWGAGDFPLLNAELIRQQPSLHATQKLDYLFDREALQEYILLCCQSENGGLLDKPGKGADHYHTCYCLSGLSTSQHLAERDEEKAQAIKAKGGNPYFGGLGSLMWKYSNEFIVVGDLDNLLAPTHPIHNITKNKVRNIILYFYGKELDSIIDLIPLDDEPTHSDE